MVIPPTGSGTLRIYRRSNEDSFFGGWSGIITRTLSSKNLLITHANKNGSIIVALDSDNIFILVNFNLYMTQSRNFAKSVYLN
jgi:hypothetical protein